MGKLIGFIGATIGSTIGWYAGAPIGIMTAVVLSGVGGGVGLYFARRAARDYFVFIAVGLIAIGAATRARAQTTPATQATPATPATIKASEELLQVMHADKAMHDAMSLALDAQVDHNPALAPLRGTMHAFADKYMTWDVVGPKLTTIYAESFTEKELRDMIAFYKSPTGQKVAAIQGVLSAKGQAMALDILQAHQAELAAMIQAQQEQQPAAKTDSTAPKPQH